MIIWHLMNSKIKVAIVEDKKLFRQGLVRLMEEFEKFEIVNESSNGLEIIEWLRHNMADIIVMDMQMPEMDGFETARRINVRFRSEPTERPRIVAMTGNAMQGDRESCLQAGMDDYITKPVRIDELKAILERWGRPVAVEAAVQA